MKKILIIVLFLSISFPAFAEVKFNRHDAGTKGNQQEASAPRIKKVRLIGCKEISCHSVRSILKLKKPPWWKIKSRQGIYDPYWAEEDRNRIEKFYRSKGYYSVNVTGPELEKLNGTVELTYRIEERQPVLVSDVEIEFTDEVDNNNDPATMHGLVGYKAGDRFESEPYQVAATAMENYYKDRGYYRAVTERSALVDLEAKTAQVFYKITRGQKYNIGDITIEGCKTTRPDVVQRAITLDQGELYSRSKVYKNQRSVARMPIYRLVRIDDEPQDQERKVDLTIKVEEGKPREIKVGLGYGSEEGVRAMIGWQHVNFLGGARELYVSARWSMLLEREEIRFVQPNVIRAGSFLQVTSERRVETEEFYSHEVIALSPMYHFIITPQLFSEVAYRLEYNRTFDVQDDQDINESDLAREGMLSALSGRLEWAKVDNPVSPSKGLKAYVFAEYSGGILGGRFPYTKAVGQVSGYYPIWDRRFQTGAPVVAVRLKGGWAEPREDLDNLPVFIRFYTGGTGSVRGFERLSVGPRDDNGDPLGGSRLFEGSLELRFPIWQEVSGVVFLDSGWVWPEWEDFDMQDVVFSSGLGLRYSTPIGPIGLDVGFPLDPGPEDPEFQIHLNIGHTF